VDESVCPVGVVLVVGREQPGSLGSDTCAELRAFHLFPSLAPDFPPTMGSDHSSNSRTLAHMHIVFSVSGLTPFLDPGSVWPSSNSLILCKMVKMVKMWNI